MRRLLVLVTVAVGATGGPALAHSCAVPVEIPVGEAATVTVGVAAEQSPVVGIDIIVPSGFRLDHAEDQIPWRAEQAGTLVRYRGGVLPPYACAFFILDGEAERQATLVFPLRVHGQDGSVVEFTSQNAGDLHPAQLVYAGFSPAAARDGPGRDWFTGALGGLLVAVVIAAGVVVVSARRERPAPARRRTRRARHKPRARR
ncbi:MAG TPA: hypothetical protein VGL92_12500 [Acidimicrobiia bacterium]|jgi:hypothetical protein